MNPPWIEHPGYPPGDSFWRQAGEAWFTLVWTPFWASLSSEKQALYLSQYEVPSEWQSFYFDAGFQNWLNSTES